MSSRRNNANSVPQSPGGRGGQKSGQEEPPAVDAQADLVQPVDAATLLQLLSAQNAAAMQAFQAATATQTQALQDAVTARNVQMAALQAQADQNRTQFADGLTTLQTQQEAAITALSAQATAAQAATQTQFDVMNQNMVQAAQQTQNALTAMQHHITNPVIPPAPPPR